MSAAETGPGELELHRKLLARDPVAPVHLADRYLSEVTTRLRRRFPGLRDPTLVDDAAADAVLGYAERPEQFDPGRGSLLAYLVMSAHGDLLNALQRERRRTAKEITVDPVELREESRNHSSDSGGHQASPDLGERAGQLAHLVEQVAKDDQERSVLELLIDGVRETSAYASVLGVANRDVHEQRRMVKRVKDRLTKRLRRLGEKLR